MKPPHLWVIETLDPHGRWVPLLTAHRFDFDQRDQVMLKTSGIFATKAAAEKQIKALKKDPHDWSEYRPVKYIQEGSK